MKSVSEYLRNGAAALLLLLAVLPLSGQVKDRQHSDRLESARKLYYWGRNRPGHSTVPRSRPTR
ncbi:MAG: hypothetical protein ACSW72_02840 [Bacteroidales bacterium]